MEGYLDDGRHVKPEVVEQVLALFGRHYLPEEEGEAEPVAEARDAADGHDGANAQRRGDT